MRHHGNRLLDDQRHKLKLIARADVTHAIVGQKLGLSVGGQNGQRVRKSKSLRGSPDGLATGLNTQCRQRPARTKASARAGSELIH